MGLKQTCNRCKYGEEIIRGDYKCEIQEVKIARDEALYPFRECDYFVFKGITLKIKKLHKNAEMPKRATAESAGFDLHCVESFTIEAGEHRPVPTGLAFEFPPGYVMLLYPRSGNAKRYGITLSNAVGVVDSDYRGEVVVLLYNSGTKPVSFQTGDRIAQAIIHRLPDIEIVECDEISDTERGQGGFGSTGS
ncbi:dUTP diphosphatase [Desulfofalx alkaliphila]|uniref:dUTP diphosphatase n=1 Tax=Desulfofalx alkaliphila TaxID=105483 RepID=UPI00068D7DAA|nr:dUTP diphosphatase [Desulfofalx alkaliphila]